eukprot:CAMPEP_0113943296 /NCGR_PEP_ID=MMETSP1339-20121228/23171_1 /TAXON_ID=94617 /ORGANISM="Fibrocapsa japonica" /LENGTH=187 /DNA_ID=CAMNT_0000948137 /DNA_START=81 /DNA_END=643 /DNA_ORIENTATION=+ /assembly_acc=CAM_ASM_000762
MDNIGPSVRNMMSRASGNEEQEESMCPKLTMQQRVIGFCICFGLGYLISFLAVMSLIKANEEGIRQFAILYIIGNIIALCGTAFLVGPKSPLQEDVPQEPARGRRVLPADAAGGAGGGGGGRPHHPGAVPPADPSLCCHVVHGKLYSIREKDDSQLPEGAFLRWQQQWLAHPATTHKSFASESSDTL